MRATFTKHFLSDARPLSKRYRYGMLAFLVGLAVFSGIVSFHLPFGGNDKYFGLVIPPMLLFNHLAFVFPWRRSIALGLRVSAVVGAAFVSLYVAIATFIR